MKASERDEWLFEISSKRKLIDLNFKEIWRYRDLLLLFVRRNVVTVYKQTILGPLWYLIQPLFTSVIFTIVFNNLGNIKTGGIPPILFNLAGITAWNYFKSSLTSTSSTFISNQGIFGKVYFPRIITPLSNTISNLLRLGIQLLLFYAFYTYYIFNGLSIEVSYYLLLLPFYLLIMALLGMGLGMILSSIATKYRDIQVLLGFAVSLLMYISAVPYPISEAKDKLPRIIGDIVIYNPLSQIIEGFRFILLNSGTFTWGNFIYVLSLSIGVFLVGLIIFNRTEKTFIDTV